MKDSMVHINRFKAPENDNLSDETNNSSRISGLLHGLSTASPLLSVDYSTVF
jgi:hypothetical protein